ncbi:hypothetical protein [Streptomyces lasiicapitis]|uniref:hypothetical protein n=1 Tax=Streptomyces lasiicapitis TaxID=1923961 RepID=UPI0036A6B1D5
MREIIAIIGWIVGVQGALGLAGRLFGDDPWGLVQKWWDVPPAGYVVLLVVGAGLVFYGEQGKARARRS